MPLYQCPAWQNIARLSRNWQPNWPELESLKGSSELQRDIEFEAKLRDLLATYGYSLRDVINLLDPQGRAGRRTAAPAVENSHVVLAN